MNIELKKQAITLRQQGFTYSEIMAKIPVHKSTLSDWLHTVGLAKYQKQRITEKKRQAQLRGAAARRQKRLDLLAKIAKEAQQDIHKFKKGDLWKIGVLLYWAEGSKEHPSSIGQQVNFTNSDPRMIKLFLKWLSETMKIPEEDLRYEIYIHTTGNVKNAIEYWSKCAACEPSRFRVYFKKHRIKKTNRTNTGDDYYGQCRISVRRSSTLNRKIAAWVNVLCQYWGVD